MTVDFTVVLPELIVALAAIVVMLADLYLPRVARPLIPWLALAGLAISLVDTLVQHAESKTGFFGSVVIDGFSLFSAGVFTAAGILVVLMSMDYLGTDHINFGEYYVLLLGTISDMMLMAAANSLIIIFLALELFSICLYVLAGFERTRDKSLESAIKYFLLSAFASAFLLYGMALTYGATGATMLGDIHSYLAHHSVMGDPILIAGIGLMIVGFAFKMSAIPFHAWTPDVYEGAPTPITALMSVGTKLAAFTAFVRLFGIALPSLQAHWGAIIWLLAVITMVGGNVAAVVQTNVKRMLAYSSIAHAGYLLIGIYTARADGREGDGVPALLFYFAVYGLMNIGAFAVVQAVDQRGNDRAMLHHFAGLGQRKPLLAGAMAVFLFSLASFPPLAGFWSKFYIFQTALQQKHGELAVIGVLCSLISVYYYLRVLFYMYLRPAEGDARPIVVPMALATAIGTAVFGILVLGVWPSGLLSLAQHALLLH